MCKAFSCLVTKAGKVYWKVGLDSHEQVQTEFKDKDLQLQDSSEVTPTFARVEVVPTNNNYLKPDGWSLQIDETVKPGWWSGRHENRAYEAQKKWHKMVLAQINVKEALKPINPFLIAPPKRITDKHLDLLREWASIGASIGASIRDSIRASIRDSIRASIGDSIRASIRDSIRDSIGDSIRASIWDSIRASIGDSIRASIGASIWDSIGDSIGASIGASIDAYIGTLFPKITDWKSIDKKKPPFNKIKGYPLQSTVKLWKLGLVPSFDGEKWRLHGGKNAKILWEGKL